MKYLRKFETADELSAWQTGSEHVTPNVVLAADTKEVQYNVAAISGVFIQHIDGTLFTMAQWEEGDYGTSVANGVAVIDSAAKFVIAKEQISSSMAWSSNTSSLVDGVLATSDSTTAKTDYAGEANTALIAAIDTSKAAYSCANYEFPNGQKGYLPALGEWAVAYNYKADIVSAMSLIGGTAISSSYHWSSTQSSATNAWIFSFPAGSAISTGKGGIYYSVCVRAFSALSL